MRPIVLQFAGARAHSSDLGYLLFFSAEIQYFLLRLNLIFLEYEMSHVARENREIYTTILLTFLYFFDE